MSFKTFSFDVELSIDLKPEELQSKRYVSIKISINNC